MKSYKYTNDCGVEKIIQVEELPDGQYDFSIWTNVNDMPYEFCGNRQVSKELWGKFSSYYILEEIDVKL